MEIEIKELKELNAENTELKEDVASLTKICYALHRRLGGGEVVIESRDLSIDASKVDIDCQARSSGKGYTVKVNVR